MPYTIYDNFGIKDMSFDKLKVHQLIIDDKTKTNYNIADAKIRKNRNR